MNLSYTANKENYTFSISNQIVGTALDKDLSYSNIRNIVVDIISKIYFKGVDEIHITEYEKDILKSYCNFSRDKGEKYNSLLKIYNSMTLGMLLAIKSGVIDFIDSSEIGFFIPDIPDEDRDFLIDTLFINNFGNIWDYTSMLYQSDYFFSNISVYSLTNESDFGGNSIRIVGNSVHIERFNASENSDEDTKEQKTLQNTDKKLQSFLRINSEEIELLNSEKPVFDRLKNSYNRDILSFFLLNIFGKSDFRDGQYESIAKILDGEDSLVLLPTGSGKSIIFQLASFLTPGTTIVICPLVSLIDDQIDNLGRGGIHSAVGLINSVGQSKSDALLSINGGNVPLFIYVTPEKARKPDFSDTIKKFRETNFINFVVIDEVHCISEWGHDFRPSYSSIKKFLKGIVPSEIPFVGLTGTASSLVLKDIERELEIDPTSSIITPKTFLREELNIEVIVVKNNEKLETVKDILENRLPDFFGISREELFKVDGNNTYGGIIFCPHSSGEFGVDYYEEALKDGFFAKSYSGKKPSNLSNDDWEDKKIQIAHEYKDNVFPLLISTKGFGMGVDKPNIRYTIHIGLPNSIESFYQEAGRSGRNYKKSKNYLIISEQDAERNKSLLDISLSASDVYKNIMKIRKDESDDVTRSLWFHFQSFRSVSLEKEFWSDFIDRVEIGDIVIDEKRFEADTVGKVLQRAEFLGVISSYDKIGNTYYFGVVPNTDDRSLADRVQRNYIEYISLYSKEKANDDNNNLNHYREQISKENDDIRSIDKEIIKKIFSIYINFIYDTLEKGRRRQIYEVLSLKDIKTSEDIKMKIGAYLGGDKNDTILNIVQSNNVFEYKTQDHVNSVQDFKNTLYVLNRYAEEYSNNIGLFLFKISTIVKLINEIDYKIYNTPINETEFTDNEKTEKYISDLIVERKTIISLILTDCNIVIKLLQKSKIDTQIGYDIIICIFSEILTISKINTLSEIIEITSKKNHQYSNGSGSDRGIYFSIKGIYNDSKENVGNFIKNEISLIDLEDSNILTESIIFIFSQFLEYNLSLLSRKN